MTTRRRTFSRSIGNFVADRRTVMLLVLIAIALAVRAWLASNPGANPWAPLNLNDRPGWATPTKLRALNGNPALCHAVLKRSNVAFTVLPSQDGATCARPDRLRLDRLPMAPSTPQMTCPLAAALELWMRDGVQPAARSIFASKVATIEQLGTFSCRRLYGRDKGPWSQHATGNAIDIAGFVLTDGTRISVEKDWSGSGRKARFLHRVHDKACRTFSTVLSPDYNAAHRSHFHLDASGRWFGACR